MSGMILHLASPLPRMSPIFQGRLDRREWKPIPGKWQMADT